MNSLNDHQKETLTRFEKWAIRLFGRTSEGDAKHFSPLGHTDAHGNVVINRGRMILIPPEKLSDHWQVTSLDEEGSKASGFTLEEVLLNALTITLRKDFISYH